MALPRETGTTYRENALAKARAVNAALGLPALGDDSGLEVDALGGAPGVRSARYAGPRASDAGNNERLLAALGDRPSAERTARFRCVLALVRAPGEETVVEAICEGRILESPRGDRGFGYDPLFLPAGETRSFAELSQEVKNRISHRARAAAALRLAVGAAAVLFVLSSCAYGPVTPRHRFTNAMPEPGGHRLAVVVITTEEREPRGFLARFPDGGKTKVLAERMRLWLCDAERGTAATLATLARPAHVQSGFTAWIVGWDPPGESSGVYVEVGGNRGVTSDTPRLRWLLRIGVEPVRGAGTALTFLPNEAVRPPGQGTLSGGRELQISFGADTIDVRADTRPEFAPMFRLDPRSGDVALLPGAAPLGVSGEGRAVRGPDASGPGATSGAGIGARPPTARQAAPAIWCDSVQLFLRRFAASRIRRGGEPYEDYLAVRKLPACSIQLAEPWSGVDQSRTPWDALGDWLLSHGFTRDLRYDADGPDGTAGLYRRGDRFCAYAAEWWSTRPVTEEKIGDPDEESPTHYRLTVWSGAAP